MEGSSTKIAELMNRLITLFPKLTLAQLTTWIDEAFPHPGSFVNSLQNKIFSENLIPAEGFKNSAEDGNSGENELRGILREILAEKTKEAGDNYDIDDL
jgi:hypothetical protein